MKVNFSDRPATDLFSDAEPSRCLRGTLTTDHATSNYGLPVVVGDDGTVYGPADLPAGDCLIEDALGSGHFGDNPALIAAARSAGFVVHSPACQS